MLRDIPRIVDGTEQIAKAKVDKHGVGEVDIQAKVTGQVAKSGP